MRHFEEGDQVRTLWFQSLISYFIFVLLLNKFYFFCLCNSGLEGFCFGDWGILYKEGPLSRIWKAFCILCGYFTEVSRNIL